MDSITIPVSIQEPARTTPVKMQVDILVVGGGPAGIIAALAAAADGHRVALIENKSFLGGNLTIGLPILDFLGQKGNQIIKGLPQKFMDRMKVRGGASGHYPCPLHMSITYIEPEDIKMVAFEMLKEAGVQVMLYTMCAGTIVENDQIKGVITESKSGREAILARVVIDCTGDADVACLAGVPCRKGNEQGGMQPPTLMFSMENVDIEKLRNCLAQNPEEYQADFIPSSYYEKNERFILVGLRNQLKKAQDDGLNINVARTIIITGIRPGEAWINMSRVTGLDGTDVSSLTNGEYEARIQIREIVKYLIQYVPGFEKSHFARMAPFIGIRETRRILGQYELTQDDILSCRHFDDAIAVASYPIDLHHPHGGDCTLEWSGDCYDIPYRCLVPQKIENLLVAGRSISSTHEAMSAIRVMAPCMAMGEAAGRAASIAIQKGIAPSAVSSTELREKLIKNGAYLRN